MTLIIYDAAEHKRTSMMRLNLKKRTKLLCCWETCGNSTRNLGVEGKSAILHSSFLLLNQTSFLCAETNSNDAGFDVHVQSVHWGAVLQLVYSCRGTWRLFPPPLNNMSSATRSRRTELEEQQVDFRFQAL